MGRSKDGTRLALDRLVEKTKRACLVMRPGGRLEVVMLPTLTARSIAAYERSGKLPTFKLKDTRFSVLAVGIDSEEATVLIGYTGSQDAAIDAAAFLFANGIIAD